MTLLGPTCDMAPALGGLFVLIMWLGCLQTAIADINCQGEAKFGQIYQECFIKNGLGSLMPSMKNYLASQEKVYLNAIMSQDTRFTCSKQESVRNGLECVLTKELNCLPDNMKGYVTRPANVGQILATLCNDIEKVDFECVKGKASGLFNCGREKGAQMSSRVDRNASSSIVCQGHQVNAECIRAELKSCGCSTLRAYQTIAIDLLYPPACPVFTQPRVQCLHDNPKRYADNGGQGPAAWASYFPVLCVLVIFHVITK